MIAAQYTTLDALLGPIPGIVLATQTNSHPKTQRHILPNVLGDTHSVRGKCGMLFDTHSFNKPGI